MRELDLSINVDWVLEQMPGSVIVKCRPEITGIYMKEDQHSVV